MSMATALRDHLLNHAGVGALIGTRMYPGAAPTSAEDLDYLVYQRISAGHEHHMSGAAGLVEERWQITCVSQENSPSTLHTLFEAVRDALDGFGPATMGTGANTANVRYCFCESDFENWEPPEHDDEAWLPTIVSEWVIWHTESVPDFV